ncbi:MULTISPECIES: hypothetical protein [Actinomadura]|uniref:Uncharacterized protein n=1 Tax=Actinomadura madurae TaxID=1993 RepID=A0A1I5KTH8_9ACTN|nr:hypothetical protein [Actinomadura madurae]MCP9949700.1 hypothetical protein [Actinomadura madurae]MCP9966446.1 hypothetical protein [Actinomadura madurae]MCP9978936.1 hypothetical protein [Actinomadura madurae]MCQ0009538.1 hypothetical protein [Actinomadura madurae]MCQ0015122.1 hypothetical protein [Actinomadura madurae]
MKATGTFHLSRPRLDGPAERTVVEPWLTQLSHATLNAYAETTGPLAEVEALPVRPVPAVRSLPARRVAAAA